MRVKSLSQAAARTEPVYSSTIRAVSGSGMFSSFGRGTPYDCDARISRTLANAVRPLL